MSKSLRSRMSSLSIQDLVVADIDDTVIAELEKRINKLEKRLGIPRPSYKSPCPFCEGRGLIYSKWTGNTTECSVCRGEGFN